MKLLIDSSTDYLLLGLISNKTNTFYRLGKCDHSETLVDYLQKFLTSLNISIDDVKEIYIGRGPGSYTGLRISGTVGKVGAYLKSIPLYSFSTLDLLAAPFLKTNGTYICKVAAMKNHSYYKRIEISNEKIVNLTEESFGKDEDIILLEGRIITTQSMLESLNEAFENIIKYNLFKEEDVMDYTPNYIRSGI